MIDVDREVAHPVRTMAMAVVVDDDRTRGTTIEEAAMMEMEVAAVDDMPMRMARDDTMTIDVMNGIMMKAVITEERNVERATKEEDRRCRHHWRHHRHERDSTAMNGERINGLSNTSRQTCLCIYLCTCIHSHSQLHTCENIKIKS